MPSQNAAFIYGYQNNPEGKAFYGKYSPGMNSIVKQFVKLSFFAVFFFPLAVNGQYNKGMRFMADGNPDAAAPFFRAELNNPKTEALALYGLSLVYLDNRFTGNQVDSAYAYILACQEAYKVLAPAQKKKIAKDLNANMISTHRRKVVNSAAARAQQAGTIQAYDYFLQRFSPLNSKTKQTALSARNNLVLVLAEGSANPSDGIILLRRYQKSFDENTPELKLRADELTFYLFMKENKLEAYPLFQQQFPDNALSRDSSFYELRQALQRNGPEALEQFVVQRSKSMFSSIATDSLASRLLAGGRIPELSRFIARFPDHPMALQLSAQMAELKSKNTDDGAANEPQPFSSAVNTLQDDYAPILSADGQSLFLCRNTPGREDIFLSTLNALGEWSEPRPVHAWNSPYSSEAPESISADGNQFFLFRGGKFFQSQKTASGWTEPEALLKPFNTFSWQADLSISADGKARLFAARDVNGDINIYVSLLQTDNSWGIPFSLGPDVNTSKHDRSPFIHPDGVTLYFSSYGRGGAGASDIFMTKRLDDTWTRWSRPENLGPPINTPGTDWGFRVSTDGQFAYYTATISGQQDIMRYRLPDAFKPEQVGTISGKMTDAAGNPLDAEIVWEDLRTGATVQVTRTDPVTGAFFAVLPQRTRYGYSVRKPGYFPSAGNVDLSTELGIVELEKTIELITFEEMRAKNMALPLNNLFFETASFEIKPESFPELNHLAELLKKEGIRIQIHGHTDNVGEEAFNLQLSQNRANSARAYLISRGCKESNIEALGFGEKKPKAGNDTAEGRAINRRVEITIQ